MNLDRDPLMRAVRIGLVFAGFAGLAGCGSSSAIKPAELPHDTAQLKLERVWELQLGEVSLPLGLQVVDDRLAVADAHGEVVELDVRDGKVRSRAAVGEALAAGVGYDGRLAAVVTQENELVAMVAGQPIWREPLSARSVTPPLVAGGRVFVLAQDRSVSAYDGGSGRRLWQQQRAGEALVLGQAGVLLPVGDTLVAGVSGRLIGLDPNNGAVRWDVALATPRGINDVERLVDLVGLASRNADIVCVRAYQSAVGCVDAVRGRLLWTRAAQGHVGLGGDAAIVYGVERDGSLLAWRRLDGEPVWRWEGLRHRRLSQAVVLPDYLVVGDDSGRLHFLSRADGATLARVKTDGTPLAAVPVRAGDMLVTVSADGAVLGWRLP